MTATGPTDASVTGTAVEDRSAGRWCAECREHGSHHTDRHAEFAPAPHTPAEVTPAAEKLPAHRRRAHRAAAIVVCALGLLAMAIFLARMFTLLGDLQLQDTLELAPYVVGGAVVTLVGLEWLDWADPEPNASASTGQEA